MKQEVEALIAAAADERHRLLFLIQWRAGLRISEAIALEPRDLYLDETPPTLRVRHGKGNKTRIVPMHPELRAALATAMAFGFGKGDGTLIPYTRQTALKWVHRAYKKAVGAGEIPADRRIGTHTLRHSAARHWLLNGILINEVQLWLGHESLATTLIYLKIIPDARGAMEMVP